MAQGPHRAVGRPRPVGRRAPGGRARARDQRVRGARVLDDRSAAGERARRNVHCRARQDRRQEHRHRQCRQRRGTRHRAARHAPAGQGAQAALDQAQPGTAVHHQHAAAGSQPPAWLQPQADHARRPGPVRGRRHARGPRRTDHLHAHRFGEHGRRRQARRTRRDRRPFRVALRGRQGPQLSAPAPRAPRRPTRPCVRPALAATQTRSPAR